MTTKIITPKNKRQLDAVCEFLVGFSNYLSENLDDLETFTEAWHNADNKTIKDIVVDYITELE